MNVGNVLTLGNSEGDIRSDAGKGENLSQCDAILFALLLNNLMGIQTGASGQNSEEQPAGALRSQDGNMATGGIAGQTLYRQLFQNLFPAGKEANSGLQVQGEQNLNSGGIAGLQAFLSSQTQPLKGQAGAQAGTTGQSVAYASTLSDSGPEGIMNLLSAESESLSPQELDQYRKILEQLQELSGKITLSAGKAGSAGKGQTAALVTKAGLAENLQAKTDPTGPTQAGHAEEKTGSLPAAAVSAKQSAAPAQEEHGQEANTFQHADLLPAPTQTDNLNGITPDSMTDPKFKVPVEAGRVWEQVADALKKQELKNNEVKELSIRLQPAELGKVDVSLRLENGQLHLAMNASEQATGAMLQNHLQELKSSLTQMGVACGNFEMNYGQNEKSGSDREFSRNNSKYPYLEQEEEIPAMKGFGAYLPANGSGSKLNVSV
jgi:flagellar hook-length control protein FliK